MTLAKSAVLYADSNRGQFIPQFFAQSLAPEMWQGVDSEQIKTLLAGPDNESYWETWESVLDYAETVDGGKLHQDGDLWVIYADSAIEAINSHCEARLEYEESHIDAGNNYSHMPGESWFEQSTRDFVAQFPAITSDNYAGGSWTTETVFPAIDCKGLNADQIATIALDNFEMIAGTIYTASLGDEFIRLDSYPIGEIETQVNLSSLGIDGITWEYIKESSSFDAVCNDTETDSPLFYQTTDVVWFAAIKRADLQELIDAESARLAE